MRPLELTIYPLLEKVGRMAEAGYIVNRRAVPLWTVDYMDKRLTDAELAAEWHYQDNRCGQKCEGYGVAHDGTSMGTEEDEIDKLRTMYRFATLPHYDEDTK